VPTVRVPALRVARLSLLQGSVDAEADADADAGADALDDAGAAEVDDAEFEA